MLVTDVRNGTLGLKADGSFTYKPDKGFSGTDSFVYKVNDGAADSNPAVARIRVRPGKDAEGSGAEEEAGGPLWVWVGLGAVALLVVGGTAFSFVTRGQTEQV